MTHRTEKPEPVSPYRGIHPFGYADRQKFFGRENVIQEICSYVLLYRLVVLFGKSGAGKSSLLNAGLIPALEREGFRPERLRLGTSAEYPILVKPISCGAQGPFLPSIFNETAPGEEGGAERTLPLGLETFLAVVKEKTAAANDRPVVHPVLIFDQFEELFTRFQPKRAEPAEEKRAVQGRLRDAIVHLALDRSLRVKLVLAIREDFLGDLEVLAKDYPRVLNYRRRLNYLTPAEAKSAILKPFSHPNSFASRLTDDLAQQIVEDIASAEHKPLATTVPDESELVATPVLPSPDEDRGEAIIPPTQVQVVCRQLWKSFAAEQTIIGRDEYARQSGVGGILKGFFRSELDEIQSPALRPVAVSALGNLITDSETRDLVSERRLQDLVVRDGATAAEVSATLSMLAERRLVNTTSQRGTLFYEVASEYLIPAIQEEARQLAGERELARAAQKAAAEAAERQRELERAQVLAAEQERRAEAERQRAEVQQRRAQEQARAAARQRRFAIGLLALFLLALGLAYVAWQRTKVALKALEEAKEATRGADDMRKEADAAKNKADLAKDREVAARKTAEEQRVRADGQAKLATNSAREADAARRQADAERKTAEDQRNRADEQANLATDNAREADAERVKAVAAEAISDSDTHLDLALLLSLEANHISGTAEMGSSLLAGLASSPYLTRFLQPGHSGVVRSVAFSPDAKILASASADGTIILWNVDTGSRVDAPLVGHTGTVFSVAFSPNGQVLASGGGDRTIRLWNVETGQPLGLLGSAPDEVYCVAFSPDGNTLASASADGNIMLWDVPSRLDVSSHVSPRWTSKGHRGGAYAVAFRPGSKILASAGADHAIALWDIDTGKAAPGSPLPGHHDEVFSLAFSPDGKTLASGGKDQTVILWNATTLKQLFPPLKGHLNSVFSVAFRQDGEILASASSDESVLLWDAHTGTRIDHDLTGHTDRTYSVAFAPGKDATTLASGGGDGTITLWDDPPRKWLGQPLEHHVWVGSVAFSPKGKMLASGGAGLVLWDLLSSKAVDPPLAPRSELVDKVTFSPDGQMLASRGRDRKITLWDVRERKPLPERLGDENIEVSSLTFKPDRNARILAWGKKDGTIVLWDVDNHRPAGPSLVGHKEPVISLAFSSDGRTLASGSSDGSIILWDGDKSNPLTPTRPANTTMSCLALSPDGSTLASATGDWNGNYITLWDVKNQKELPPLTKHRGVINALEFSPDGKTLASGSTDKTIILWDVATRQIVGRLREQNATVYALAFSPDGETLASGSDIAESKDNWPLVLWAVSSDSQQARACQIASRNLTQEEWHQYIGRKPYRVTCPTALLKEADADALTKKVELASKKFRQLVELASQSSDSNLNNSICWYGSLDEFASIVEPACKRAVQLESENGMIRDSRGVARAMMGPEHYAEAIEDFEFFLNWSEHQDSEAYQEPRVKRKGWIEKLKNRQNPFDPETLRALRRE